jgi:DNA primase
LTYRSREVRFSITMNLISLLSQILGDYKEMGKGEHYFHCPFCHHHHKKFAVNIIKNKWKCWICGARGNNLIGLFKKLDVSPTQIKELKKYLSDDDIKIYRENPEEVVSLQLPYEYKPLWKPVNTYEYKHAVNYLKKRGISGYDIIRYRMGYCETGHYGGRIIVPSYDITGKLNYFIARSYHDTTMKYKNPPVSKNVVVFEEQINWNEAIILVEGVFDAISVRRNAIPMLGKFLPKKLEVKLLENQVKNVYILLDDDARTEALQLEQKLKAHGINVSQVSVSGGDAAELGFQKTWEFINNAQQTTFKDFIQNRLQNT